MGQKVNPTGLRLGFNQDWRAHWFSDKNFAGQLHDDAIIRDLITKRHARAGIAGIDIFRQRGDIAIVIHTAKPGIIIGRSGAGAQELKAKLEHALFMHIEGKANRPSLRISIVEVKNPELNARLVAENIAGQIERRISVKRAIKQAVERTMEKRAKGIKIRVSGRIGGAEIARNELVSHGSIPLQTLRSDISYALAEAKTTFGVIGIKVWIYLGESEDVPFETASSDHMNRSKSR